VEGPLYGHFDAKLTSVAIQQLNILCALDGLLMCWHKPNDKIANDNTE